MYRIAKWLRDRLDAYLENFCSVCGKRLVLYRDGMMDCPDLNASERERRGGRAGYA
jgi:hypothetical protein